MKIAPIYWAVRGKFEREVELNLVHSGQHYRDDMRDALPACRLCS